MTLYSPLFIDIVDNYNQYYSSTSNLNDPFYFLHSHALVRSIIDNCVSFQSVCDMINSYNPQIGGDYIDDYLQCYNYWYSHNN